jgi:hypothetical protein
VFAAATVIGTACLPHRHNLWCVPLTATAQTRSVEQIHSKRPGMAVGILTSGAFSGDAAQRLVDLHGSLSRGEGKLLVTVNIAAGDPTSYATVTGGSRSDFQKACDFVATLAESGLAVNCVAARHPVRASEPLLALNACCALHARGGPSSCYACAAFAFLPRGCGCRGDSAFVYFVNPTQAVVRTADRAHACKRTSISPLLACLRAVVAQHVASNMAAVGRVAMGLGAGAFHELPYYAETLYDALGLQIGCKVGRCGVGRAGEAGRQHQLCVFHFNKVRKGAPNTRAPYTCTGKCSAKRCLKRQGRRYSIAIALPASTGGRH